MITITENEFLSYTGISLSVELKDLDESSQKVSRTISLWTKRVYQNINRIVNSDEEYSSIQVQTIKDAICEYGMYYLRNGDLYRASGYSEDKGTIISQQEIEKIKFPQHVYDMLRRSGLIRRSLSVRTPYSQTHDNTYIG